MNRRSIAAALAVLVPALLSGQNANRGDSVSASIRDVRYDITFMRSNAAQRTIEVAMSFNTTGTSPVLLSLPAWTPGAYEISNFSRWVVDFAATADGKPLSWDKLDFDTWRVKPAGAKALHVSLRYLADTLDNAMAWAKPDFLLFNGTNVFLYAEGQSLDIPATVVVHTETDWHVATGMPSAHEPRTFTAANYHDLVDMPFFVGRFDLDSARVAEKWIRLATYPAGAITAQVRSAAWDQLKRVIPPETTVFGEIPWDTYTVMEIIDSAYAGASGLEHQNSHVDVLAPSYVGSEFQPSLFAHEIFHSWNVKRLRPAEMWPYQYSHPQPTPWLWVSEGITDYYADLAEVRGGVIDERAFYNLSAEKINEVMNARPVSLEDASLNTWVHPIDGTEYIYYPKGSLAGFILDIMIRDASDNKHSLDDVMRGLYQSDYKHGRGFTATDWWNAVSAAAAGKSFTQFTARYIDGREAFPWDSILPLAGMRTRQERVPRLGVMTQPDPSGVVVANVQEGSSAANAGVKPGDYLISVGDIPVEDQQFGAKMRAKYGASVEGSPLQIKVRRGADTVVLAGKLQFAPGDVVLEADPSAKPKAVKIRNGILKGTTG
ncbi:MAG TPA: PDZ domain-containing protein [Gemmatimonadaceae bacterium]|jgi:predicted metalloprotease with PDZ domain|nr:PDZ domain-containing protein [Gemmatimonadaceae bacterium]